MKKKRAARMLFAVTDYLRDTRCLSLAARGAWMDILCALWHADTRGSKSLTIAGWAGEIGKSVDEVSPILDELRSNRIAEFTERDGLIVIANRRMVRERVTVKEVATSELGFAVEQSVSLAWILEQWKTIPGIVQPRIITDTIKTRVERFIVEHPDLAWWNELFSLIRQSDFLRGLTIGHFQVSLDWVLRKANIDKILAGNYANVKTPEKINGKAFTACTWTVKSGYKLVPCKNPICEDAKLLGFSYCEACWPIYVKHRERIGDPVKVG